jgi:hypothetical protein
MDWAMLWQWRLYEPAAASIMVAKIDTAIKTWREGNEE